MNKLALGTVQFGLPYGATNLLGQVALTEVKKILQRAHQAGIKCLDTAQSYGNSEEVLGQCLSDPFRIVTKTLPLRKKKINKEDIESVRNAFLQSLIRLKKSKVDVLLVHMAEDLLADGGIELWVMLEKLKTDGLCEKIGASLYDPKQLEKLDGQISLDIVQIPLNILDQRFLQERSLAIFSRKKIEVHARSLFMQGILLSDPQKLNPYFTPFIKTLKKLEEFRMENNLSALDLCLEFIKKVSFVEAAPVGVSSLLELDQIIESYERVATLHKNDFATLACSIPALINPSLWPKF